VLEVQAVAVEFLDTRRRDDYASIVAGLDDVEGEKDGLAESP